METLPEEAPPIAVDAAPAKAGYVLSPSGFRRLLESLIIFLGIILFLRASAVEPFGVPTGSMAPTLTGDHLALRCPDCGSPIRIGKPTREDRFSSDAAQIECPNCARTGISLENAPVIVGDRLLVDKNTFTVRSPQRWEVAVFWCPVDSTKPYVKRVVGRPGEKILLQGGDILVDGQIARKSMGEALELLVPVYDMAYLPEKGWASRWSICPPPERFDENARVPLPSILVSGSEIRLEGSKEPNQTSLLEYVHRVYDERSGQEEERPITDQFAYNSAPGYPYPVYDFFVSFDLEVLPGQGTFFCELNDGHDRVTAQIALGPDSPPSQLDLEVMGGAVRESNDFRLEPGKTYRVEMAHIDRRITVRIDRKSVFKPLDLEPVTSRNDVSRPVRLGIRGGSAVVRNFRLARDVFYRPQGDHGVGVACELGVDEYFMLGDNSANSDDSRTWRIPGVPEADIFGKPFLLHQPSKRAKVGLGEKEIEFPSVDWSRIRWLR
jgi:signal peptidase I